jgi:hypothetical protein
VSVHGWGVGHIPLMKIRVWLVELKRTARRLRCQPSTVHCELASNQKGDDRERLLALATFLRHVPIPPKDLVVANVLSAATLVAPPRGPQQPFYPPHDAFPVQIANDKLHSTLRQLCTTHRLLHSLLKHQEVSLPLLVLRELVTFSIAKYSRLRFEPHDDSKSNSPARL